MQWQRLAAVARVSGGRADHEEKLPGERVEVPGLIGGMVVRWPAEPPRHQIDGRGDDERQRQRAPHQQQHEGEDAQENHVDRQDIEELRLILQQQRFDDRDLRLVDEVVDDKILAVGLVLYSHRRVTDRRREEKEFEDVRDVKLPCPAIKWGSGGDWPLPLLCLSIYGLCGVAAY